MPLKFAVTTEFGLMGKGAHQTKFNGNPQLQNEALCSVIVELRHPAFSAYHESELAEQKTLDKSRLTVMLKSKPGGSGSVIVELRGPEVCGYPHIMNDGKTHPSFIMCRYSSTSKRPAPLCE